MISSFSKPFYSPLDLAGFDAFARKRSMNSRFLISSCCCSAVAWARL